MSLRRLTRQPHAHPLSPPAKSGGQCLWYEKVIPMQTSEVRCWSI